RGGVRHHRPDRPAAAGPSTHHAQGGPGLMDLAPSPETEELRQRLPTFMDAHVHPAEAVLQPQLTERENPWTRAPVVRELQAEARKRGLWNLFLAGHPEHGGLPNLQYAPLAEI